MGLGWIAVGSSAAGAGYCKLVLTAFLTSFEQPNAEVWESDEEPSHHAMSRLRPASTLQPDHALPGDGAAGSDQDAEHV